MFVQRFPNHLYIYEPIAALNIGHTFILFIILG
jgi:hypothetical protein